MFLVHNKKPIHLVVRKIFRKTNISYPLIRTCTCAYQGIINVSFPENFVYVLNGWAQGRCHEEKIFYKMHKKIRNYCIKESDAKVSLQITE